MVKIIFKWSSLTALLVILKLTGVVSWSWLWVLLPLWIFPASFLAGFVVTFIIGMFVIITDGSLNEKSY